MVSRNPFKVFQRKRKADKIASNPQHEKYEEYHGYLKENKHSQKRRQLRENALSLVTHGVTNSQYKADRAILQKHTREMVKEHKKNKREAKEKRIQKNEDLWNEYLYQRTQNELDHVPERDGYAQNVSRSRKDARRAHPIVLNKKLLYNSDTYSSLLQEAKAKSHRNRDNFLETAPPPPPQTRHNPQPYSNNYRPNFMRGPSPPPRQYSVSPVDSAVDTNYYARSDGGVRLW